MDILYINVRKEFQKQKIAYPNFNLFRQRGTVISVAQWQPKGTIEFEEKRGFYSKDSMHYRKAEAFMECAVENNSDIVVTPEYSFPWGVLDKILTHKCIKIGNGRLWCLGMEGIAYQDFIEFIDRHNASEGIRIITENLDDIIVKNFLSCLVYVFVSAGEIICIVQFKTTAASDKWAELEASGLTTGNTMFYFDDNDGGNCLMSIICADALNQINIQFNKELNYSKYLLLHPQLNPKPLHDSFRHMRKNLMSFSFSNMRILTQNWSKDTQLIIDDSGEATEIKESYSACYYYENGKVDALYKKNKSKGINLGKEDHVFIWHMPDQEHCVIYYIDSYGLNGINPSASKHEEPVVKSCMLYDAESEKWLSVAGCRVCSVDWEWLSKQFELEQCTGGACNINQLHRFFAILFSKEMYEDLNMENGMSKVIFSYPRSDSEYIYMQRERCESVCKQLEKENIPPQFPELRNHNYRWVLSDKGNLEMVDNDNEGSRTISIVYIDSGHEYAIKKGIMVFKKNMGISGDERMKSMILYYWTEEGIKFYDKFYNTDINNPNAIHSLEEIR